jgi:hypothetical protein
LQEDFHTTLPKPALPAVFSITFSNASIVLCEWQRLRPMFRIDVSYQ